MIVTYGMLNDVLTDKSVLPNVRLVYLRILNHYNEERGCFAGEDCIADDLGISRSTVARAIATLVEKGWIKRIQRFAQKTNFYVPRKHINTVVEAYQNDTPEEVAYQNDTPRRIKMTRPIKEEKESKEKEIITAKAVMQVEQPATAKSHSPEAKMKTRKACDPATKLVTWFYYEFLGYKPANFGKEMRHAKSLLDAGLIDNETHGEMLRFYEWCQSQTWITSGITLGLMSSVYNQFRSPASQNGVNNDRANWHAQKALELESLGL